MNFDFSIESSAERIQNHNTKDYFKEVYQTYVNGNYRSSAVMLYSVMICDLVYKLRDLRDIYADPISKKILDDIEDMQTKNPKSPDWESKLIDFIASRTTLLEPSDIAAAESLQKIRHLSAHPILTNTDLLYSPNRETVQSLIRNILEGVLVKPPFFSNKIFESFLSDLIDVKDQMSAPKSLSKYINSRYLSRLKEGDFRKLFRSLWKVVFVSSDQKAIENQKINFRALNVFLQKDKNSCIDSINKEKSYFSNISNPTSIDYLIRLLSRFPEIHESLESSLQILLKSTVDKNEDYVFVSWFYKNSLKEHLLSLVPSDFQNLKNGISFLKPICIQNDCKDEFFNFLIGYFGESSSFQSTSERYETAIKDNYMEFNLDQISHLLEVSNTNRQIYGNWGMADSMRNIISNSQIDGINKADYGNIFK